MDVDSRWGGGRGGGGVGFVFFASLVGNDRADSSGPREWPDELLDEESSLSRSVV